MRTNIPSKNTWVLTSSFSECFRGNSSIVFYTSRHLLCIERLKSTFREDAMQMLSRRKEWTREKRSKPRRPRSSRRHANRKTGLCFDARISISFRNNAPDTITRANSRIIEQNVSFCPFRNVEGTSELMQFGSSHFSAPRSKTDSFVRCWSYPSRCTLSSSDGSDLAVQSGGQAAITIMSQIYENFVTADCSCVCFRRENAELKLAQRTRRSSSIAQTLKAAVI